MSFVSCPNQGFQPALAKRSAVSTRAQHPKNAAQFFVANLLAAGAATADVPSLDDLKAIQYESVTSPAVESTVKATQSVDLSGLSDAAPLIGGLAAGIVLVGAGIAALTSGPKGPRIQSVSAARAIELLANEEDCQLLDIRAKADIKETGAPDLRSVSKSVLSLPFTPSQQGQNKPTSGTVAIGWPEKVARLPKVTEETAVVLIDSDGTQSAAAARELATVYPEAEVIYYVVGGTEGPKGWLESDLPWREPLKLGLNMDTLKALDFSGVAAGTEKLVEKYKENPSVVNGTVAAVAVAGASVFLLSEVETILEVVGVLAAGQFLAQRLLFANDRQRTFEDIKKLLTEKIAAGEAGRDLTKLASTLLDSSNIDDLVESTRDTGAASTAQANAQAAKKEAGEAIEAAAEVVDDAKPEPKQNVKGAQEWIAQWKAKQKQAVKVQ